MSKKIQKQFGLEIKSKNSEKREITVIGSQLGVDRDRDIVDIKSMNLKNFKNNPVILWSHRSSELPIGKAISIQKAASNTQLKFKIQFATEEENPFADSVYRLVKGGYINASSIGFKVNYEKSEYDKDRGGYNLNNSELLELSLVNVPANADALIQTRSFEKALEDKVISKDELKIFNEIKEDTEETNDTEEVSEQIINNIIERLNQIELSIQELKIKNIEVKSSTYIDDLFSTLVDELDTKSNSSLDSKGKIDDSDLDEIIKLIKN